MKFILVINLFMYLALVKAPEVVRYGLEKINIHKAEITDISKVSKEKYITSLIKSNRKIFKRNTTVLLSFGKEDFIPKTTKVKKELRSSIVYSKVKKISNFKDTKIELKKINTRKEIEIIEIESDDFELSLNEIKEQDAIVTIKIKKIAWSKISIPKEDNAFKLEKIAKIKTIKRDRISTIVAAQEKSIKQEISDGISKLKNHEKYDELVFFDYLDDDVQKAKESPKKRKEITQTLPLSKDILILDVSEKEISHGELVQQEDHLKIDIKDSTDPVLDEVSAVMKKLNTQKDKPNMGTHKNTKVVSVINTKQAAPQISMDTQTAKRQLAHQIQKIVPKIAKASDSKLEVSDALSFIQDEKTSKEEDYSCLNKSNLTQKAFNAKYQISLRAIDNKKWEKIHNFEIRFNDDDDDIAQDYGSGEISLNYNLVSEMNIRRGTIYAGGYYPLSLDFIFEGLDTQMDIPIISREKMKSIVSEGNLAALGAQLLVELDDDTEDIELDINNKYEAKIYLNERMEVIDRSENEYSYIMFLGATPGNTIINFRNIRNEVISKVIYLTDKEMYYEPNFYAKLNQDKFSLYSESLLSKCKGLLNIDSEKIKPWSDKTKVKKESLNSYKLDKITYPLGTRRYYELGHMSESIYIGRWSENHVIVPTEDLIGHVLDYFRASENQCIVQLNLSKKLDRISINSYGQSGVMKSDAAFLDEDGQYYDDVSSTTRKIFIRGEDKGIFYMKLKYTDDSFQYIQSFCSDNTYLVEQL